MAAMRVYRENNSARSARIFRMAALGIAVLSSVASAGMAGWRARIKKQLKGGSGIWAPRA